MIDLFQPQRPAPGQDPVQFYLDRMEARKKVQDREVHQESISYEANDGTREPMQRPVSHTPTPIRPLKSHPKGDRETRGSQAAIKLTVMHLYYGGMPVADISEVVRVIPGDVVQIIKRAKEVREELK